MSKYTSHVRSDADKRPWKIHPIWRGFGCLWLIMLPLMSFAGAKLIVRSRALPLPNELLTRIRLPYLDYPWMSFPIDLNILINWLPERPLLAADVLIIAALIFLGFGIMSVAYSFLYRFFGPPRSVFDDPKYTVSNPRRHK